MKFASRLVALAALVYLASAAPASAQYMYLDTDGDGVSTAADKLNENCTPTPVSVYLVTDADRLGNPATCDDPVSPGDLTINSYVIGLRVTGGTATFTNFVNADPAGFSTTIAIERRSDTEWQRGQGGGTAQPPSSTAGPYKLMTLTVTGATGTPALEIATSTALSSLKTSFGTQCPGIDGDNTYKLGSDWFDVDGAAAADVANGKNMPTITVPATVSGAENTPASITATSTDADADLVTLSQTKVTVPAAAAFLTGPTTAGPSLNPSITLTGTPSFTQSGTTTITWTADDGNACIRTATSIVTIANVDRPPTVTAPASASVNEGSPLSFTVSAIDPDVQTITAFTAAGPAISAGATFTVNAGSAAAGRVGTLAWTPTSTQSGSYSVTFTATNALSNNAITFITVNDAATDASPSVTAPTTASVNENSLLTINVTANDPDGPAITTLAATGTAVTGGATFAAGAGNTSGTLSWTPTFTQAGSFGATFTASNVLSGSASTAITVNNVDRAPVVTAPATASVNELSPLSFTVSASDPDAEALTSISAAGTAITAGASFTPGAGNTSGTFNWTPSLVQSGSYAATFTAANALFGTASTAITVNNLDRAPTVTAPATASVNELSLLTITVTANDPDAEAITSLTATGTAVTAGATFAAGAGNTSGTLSWTPTSTQSGSYAATFTASNALSGSASTAITVINVAVDNPPIVTAPATASVNENSLLTINVTAADADGPAITSLTATGTAVTAGATFVAGAGNTSGTMSWTPTFTQSGSFAATFTASNVLSGSASTAITVNNVDRAPTVTAPATASVNENSPLTVNVTANDPDAQAITSLTATGTAVTAGATFAAGGGNTSGTLSWTPTFTQAGSYAATFTATNALSGSASTAITVNNVDRAPTVTAPATASVNENSLLTVNVTANDPDAEAIASLTATGTAITAGATFAAGGGNTSGTLSWTPTFTQSGSFAATFTATNALSGSASTAITVNNVDRAPTVTAPATQNGQVGILLTFTVSANDPDAQAITSLTAAGTAITAGATFTAGAGNTSGTLSWTPAGTGSFGATFTASNALSGSASTSITVAAGNPPVVTAPSTASVNENSLLTINVTAADADGPAIASLTATGTAVTAGATFVAGAGNTSGTLSWTPTFTQAGSYAATFTAANTLTGSASTAITVNNVDRAPTVTAPATASVNENSPLTVNVTANDPDAEAITSLTAAGTAVTAGATFAAGAGNTSGTLSWTPTFTQAGSYAATFTATNALSGSASTAITVNNVDRAPTVTAPATANGNVSTLITFTVSANDPDGEAIASLTATGTAITAGATFTAGAGNTSGTFSWTPASTGSFGATFTASNALSGSASTSITVGAGGAPVVTAPATASVNENSLLTVNVTASDADGPAITSLTATGTAITAGASFAAGAGNTTGALTWTPTFTQAGSYGATFTATNTLSGSASTAITVNNVDRAPTVTAPATASVNENSLLTVNVTANDPDAEAITSLTATGTAITAGATFAAGAGNTSGTLSWTPTFTQAGSYAATFTATNALSGSASTAITVNNVDRAPAVTAPPSANGPENTLITFTVSANDPDGDAIASLTATGTAITAGASFAANGSNTSGTFSWTPTTGQSGSYAATFTASNALSGSASTAISVGVDLAPTVTAPATASVNEGFLLTIPITANDPDGAIASLTATGSAITAGGAFTAGAGNTSGSFTWAPTFTQAGSYGVTFTAGNALSGSASTAITVNDVDRAPTVTAPATASVSEGALLTVNVTAADADGDAIASLTATGTAITAGATFAPGAGNTTGELSWATTTSDAGSYGATFTASNALSGSASTAITVVGENQNPVVTAPSTASVDEGQLLTFSVSATDGDGDHVTLSMTGGTAGMSFADNGDNSGSFSWTPSFSQAGSFTVTFTGNDGNGGSGSASTAITVNNVNRGPTADAGGPYSGVTGVPVGLDGTGSSDPDGDALTYDWVFGDGEAGTGANVSHTYASVGSFTATLTVTDPSDLSDDDDATVTIADVFPANAFVVGGNKTTRLGAGKPFTCVQIEPVNGSYDNDAVSLSSIVMIYAGNRISASDKTSNDGDKNQNGIAEIQACFAKEDLRTLFAGLSGGAHDVEVTIEGNLSGGGRLQAALTLRIVASGGALQVMASPNPLNPDTELSFVLSRAGQVRVQIFDLSGRLVKTVLDEPRGEGYQTVRWNGSDRNGGKVASGVYYFRIQADGVEAVQRVTVLK